MKTKAILLSFVIVAITQMVNSQTFDWAKRLGGEGSDSGNGIAVDINGNVYTVGDFEGISDFDPGPNTFNLIAEGGSDVFISKLDASGNFIWAKKFGGENLDNGAAIAIDEDGNIYTTGYFRGTVDFDPGMGTHYLTSVGYSDVFISKLDASGNFIWAKQLGGDGFDMGSGIAIDDSGNIYVTGDFQQTVDFDPNAGVFDITAAGDYDVFILKLDAFGNFVWAKKIGGIDQEKCNSITVDGAGNVYTTGRFLGACDFDPGPDTYTLTPTGLFDTFISKLDSDGGFLWAKQIGGISSCEGNSLAVDVMENVYLTGYFAFTVDFDPGANIFEMTAAGMHDIFVAKLNESGDFAWAKQMGGAGDDYGYSIALDENGNVYTTGSFRNTADFDPGVNSFNLIAYGNTDIFISKLDSLGNFIWAHQLSGSSFESGHSITVNNVGNVYTTGYFSGTVDFDFSASSNNITSLGANDVFVHKLYQCENTFGTDVQIACVSYTWIDNNTYTSSNNTATFILPNALGCDSLVTLDLTINSVSDITTTTAGISITANNGNATYQWLDCNNNYAIIPGETNQSYTPIANGSYAVELTENGCVDTSDCVAVTTVGIVENTIGNLFTVYPNPTNGELTIVFENEFSDLQLNVRNIMGQEIFQKNYSSGNQINLTLEGAVGVYFIDIIDGDKRALLKVVKE
jgi:hypothetical protein